MLGDRFGNGGASAGTSTNACGTVPNSLRHTRIWREHGSGAAFAVPRYNRRFCRLTGEFLRIGNSCADEHPVPRLDASSTTGGRRAIGALPDVRPTILWPSPSAGDNFVGSLGRAVARAARRCPCDAVRGGQRPARTAHVPNSQYAAVTRRPAARTRRAVVGSAGAPCARIVTATLPGIRDSRSTISTDEHMMSPLRVSIAFATSALMLVGCEDSGARAETAASHSRESSLASDLALAGDSSLAKRIAERDSLAKRIAERDSQAVTQSSGMLESAGGSEPSKAGGSPATRNASNVSSPAASSAEGYIGPSCASPAREDQQRCLSGYLAKSDLVLDRYYQALILRLKSEAETKARAPDPPTVRRLRDAQRKWLVYRDDECRKRTSAREGPLWAPVRAKCLAEYSALRARELDDALAKRKALSKAEQPSTSKRPSARRPSRQRSSRG